MGVATLAWTYATPLFYPENIIPDHFKFIQTYNPISLYKIYKDYFTDVYHLHQKNIYIVYYFHLEL